MGLIWTLKKTMVLRRDLYRPSDLRAALAEHAGVRLSLPAVGSLINKQPEALRLRTIQAICNTLNCRLSDFCEVEPDGFARSGVSLAGADPRPLYGRPKSSEAVLFPAPSQFATDIDD